MSLEDIRKLFRRKKFSLKAALRFQRFLIEARRAYYERVARVIDEAERDPSWDRLRKIIETIRKEDPMEWTKKYYSEEARKELATRSDPQASQQGARNWAELIQDVEAAIEAGVKPKSEEGQALAARWSKLIAAFSGGSPRIVAGLKKMYSDPGFKKPYSDEVGEFISAARME